MAQDHRPPLNERDAASYIGMSVAYRLLVREHLLRKPRRDLHATVPPEVRAKLPLAFADVPTRIPVHEHVDRDRHPEGWGYDLVGFASIDKAAALPIEGQA